MRLFYVQAHGPSLGAGSPHSILGSAHHAGAVPGNGGSVYRYGYGRHSGHPRHCRGGSHRYRQLAHQRHGLRYRRRLPVLHFQGLRSGRPGQSQARGGSGGAGYFDRRHRFYGAGSGAEHLGAGLDAGRPFHSGAGQPVFFCDVYPHAGSVGHTAFRKSVPGGGGQQDPHAGGADGEPYQRCGKSAADLSHRVWHA